MQNIDFKPGVILALISVFLIGLIIGNYGTSSPLFAQRDNAGSWIQTTSESNKENESSRTNPETRTPNSNSNGRIFSIQDRNRGQQSEVTNELKNQLQDVKQASVTTEKVKAIETLLESLIEKRAEQRRSRNRALKLINEGLTKVMDGHKILTDEESPTTGEQNPEASNTEQSQSGNPMIQQGGSKF